MIKFIEKLTYGLLLITLLLSPLTASQKPDGSPFDMSGSIEIISAPDKAMVHLDGEKKGLTPYKAKDLSVGEHTLKIHKQGYEDHIQSFTIVAGPNKSIGVALVKLTDVTITTKPKGATLYLDGDLVGTTPFNAKLPTGKHTLQLKLLGYADWEQEAIIVENYSNKVSLLKLFRISFTCEPTAAEVFMDNKYIGDTPFSGDYSIGKHQVKSRWKGMKPLRNRSSLKRILS